MKPSSPSRKKQKAPALGPTTGITITPRGDRVFAAWMLGKAYAYRLAGKIGDSIECVVSGRDHFPAALWTKSESLIAKATSLLPEDDGTCKLAIMELRSLLQGAKKAKLAPARRVPAAPAAATARL